MKTKIFREQHEELLQIADEIALHLDASRLSIEANEARKMLSALVGKLNIHLAMEDKGLYPELLNHSDERIKSIAHTFVTEMGGIADVVRDYNNTWASPLAIQQSPDAFIRDTKNIFNALVERIEKENTELYPLLDKLP